MRNNDGIEIIEPARSEQMPEWGWSDIACSTLSAPFAQEIQAAWKRLMRDNTAEQIADRREAIIKAQNEVSEAACRVRLEARDFANIGPPKPLAWWLYPKPQSCDSGLRELRERCYAKIRQKHAGM